MFFFLHFFTEKRIIFLMTKFLCNLKFLIEEKVIFSGGNLGNDSVYWRQFRFFKRLKTDSKCSVFNDFFTILFFKLNSFTEKFSFFNNWGNVFWNPQIVFIYDVNFLWLTRKFVWMVYYSLKEKKENICPLLAFGSFYSL